MITIDAKGAEYKILNEQLRDITGEVTLQNCCGQRFLAVGMAHKDITIEGVPGNALGAYLNGATVTLRGNAQDAVGDTMNEGKIIIHGSIGDAAGYAMRGGKMFVRDSAGYRAGIHMKAYEEKTPLLVIGGSVGSFLGEYQAGGTIVVLGLDSKDGNILGGFPCTGMHGGKMFLRSACEGVEFPGQVCARAATEEDKAELEIYVQEYCELFNCSAEDILDATFTVIVPDSKNPYKQMYVEN